MSLSPSRKEHYNLDNSHVANHTGFAVKCVFCFLVYEHRFYGARVYTHMFFPCVCVVHFEWLKALIKKKDWSPVMVCHVDQQRVTDVFEKCSASICTVIKTKISLWSCKMLLTSWHGRTHIYSTLRTIGRNYCKRWGRHMGIGVNNRRDSTYQHKINFHIQRTVHRDIFS